MREVTASRVVDASPDEIWARFDPETIVEAEGSFTVETVEDAEDGTVVLASATGMQLPLRFEYRDDVIYYTQDAEKGPFSHMETWLECDPEASGTRVRMRSSVSLSAPLPFGDRIAAWKRKAELNRVLDEIEDAFA